MLLDCSQLLGPFHPQLLPESSLLDPPPPLAPSELSLGGWGREEERVIVRTFIWDPEPIGHKGLGSSGDFWS